MTQSKKKDGSENTPGNECEAGSDGFEGQSSSSANGTATSSGPSQQSAGSTSSSQKSTKSTSSKSSKGAPSSFDFAAFRKELLNMFTTATDTETGTLTLESITSIVRTAAAIGGESFKAALEMISEFIKETTGVDSVKVTPSVAPQLDVEIQCRREADIPIGTKVAPMVELSSIRLGKRIHFQALLNKHEKGIQVNIKDGLEMTFSLGSFFGKQTVPVRGSAMLARNPNGEVCLVTQVVAPGTDTPVTMRMPLRKVFDHARKTWMAS